MKNPTLALIFCLLTGWAQGANYCVGPTATGSGSGADWSNQKAWTDTIVRGDTWYLRGGAYSRKVISTPVSGTNLIVIRKASPTSHLTDMGWQASYGTQTASWTVNDGNPVLQFSTGNWVFDGVYRNEANWFDAYAYGFAITNTWATGAYTPSVSLTGVWSNALINCVYSLGPSLLNDINQGAPHHWQCNTESWKWGIHFSRNYCELGYNACMFTTAAQCLIESNAFWGLQGSSTAIRIAQGNPLHGDGIDLYFSAKGSTVRYNIMRDFCNGGHPNSVAASSTCPITYCNASSETPDYPTECYGNIIDGWTGEAAVEVGWIYNGNQNVRIHNNTFISRPETDFCDGRNGYIVNALKFYNTKNSAAYNNLVYFYCANPWYVDANCTGIDMQSNIRVTDPSVFVDFANHDYRLRAPMAGTAIASPYNRDMKGNVRGADGVFDVGALEYAGAIETNPPVVILTAPTNGASLGGTFTLSATAIDDTGMADVAFYAGGTQVGDVTSAPYACTYDSSLLTNGVYQVYAIARDLSGNLGFSATNSITISNAPVSLPTPSCYWSFNEGFGTVAQDSVSANTLTLRTGSSWGAGQQGTALVLDGAGGRADCPNNPGLDLHGTNLSVAVWVNLQRTTNWMQVVAKIKDVGVFTAPYFSWHIFGADVSATQWRPQFQVVNASGVSVNVGSSTLANYNQWVQVVGVYDGSTVRVYVNGEDCGSAAQSGNIMSYSQPLYVGCNGLPSEYAKGAIDELQIYSSSLSAAQVRRLYSDGQPLPPLIVLSTHALSFGAPLTNTTTASITISNGGGGTLSGSCSVPFSPFSITGPASYSLTNGQSATITFSYTPITKQDSTTAIFTGGSGATTSLSGGALVYNNYVWFACDGYTSGAMANSTNNGVSYAYLSPPGVSGVEDTTLGRSRYYLMITNEGDYTLQSMVQGSSLSANSFYWSWDREPDANTNIWDINPLTSGFEQRTAGWRGRGTYDNDQFPEVVFHLTPGLHCLNWVGRQANTLVNGFALSSQSVVVPPAITYDPQDVSVTSGSSASFSVSASGSAPLAYQWRLGGVSISGATQSSYTTNSVPLAANGSSYSVVVTNAAGVATSAVAVLSVVAQPQVPSITTQPVSARLVQGCSTNLSVIAGGTSPLSYQWLLNGVSIANATSPSLSLDNVSQISAGDYSCVVTNPYGSITSDVATVQVITPVTINTPRMGFVVFAGGSLKLSVVATGTEPLSYQWSHGGIPIPDATIATYYISSANWSDAGSYSCTVSNEAGPVSKVIANVDVVLPSGRSTSMPHSGGRWGR